MFKKHCRAHLAAALIGLAALSVLFLPTISRAYDPAKPDLSGRQFSNDWAAHLNEAVSQHRHIHPANQSGRERSGWLFGRRRGPTTGADIVFGRRNGSEPHRQPRRYGRPVKPAPKREMSRMYLPTVVDFEMSYAPGTIVIDTKSRFLYLVLEDGQARRYGVGVGRSGFGWSGTVEIGRKAEWPGWTPPEAMRKRQPWLPEYMEGGIDNPLGARALYLFKGGKDTIYRIHGSNEPWTIGQAVSSGCFRMRNEDVTELYERVGVGTTVVVL